jgi:DnaJ-class molecular chaperone
LSDPEKRKIYDKYGLDGIDKQIYETPKYQGDKKKCKNRLHFLHVDLEDVYLGSSLNVVYTRKSLCKGCDGTGTDNPAARRKCNVCQGKGEKLVMQRMGIMLVQNVVECVPCGGTGWEKSEEFLCEDCKGKMVSFEKKNIKVELEKGTPDGYRFTFFGEGDKIPKIQDGDLIIEVVLKKHKYFRREGADIWYRLDLSLLEAITGFKKLIPSLNKSEQFEVSTSPGEIVQSGEVRVLVGKGIPFFNNPRKSGNLFIEFNVVFPTKIKEEKLLKVDTLLKERNHNKVSEENNDKSDKEIYYLTEFKPEEANLSVMGGKQDKEGVSKSNIYLKFIYLNRIFLSRR